LKRDLFQQRQCAQGWSGQVVRFEPTATLRGDISVDLDLDGALLRFIALGVSESGRSQTPVDWSVLFSAARLDLSRFTPTAPGSTVAAVDARMAWLGTDESRSPTPIRIEAGAFHGRPMYFEVFYPWTAGAHRVATARSTVNNRRTSARPLPVALLAWVLFPVTATVLAWRNWKTNRGDVRGAALVGLYIFSTYCVATVLGAHSPVLEIANGEGLPLAMAAAVIAAICYLALEPWVRRRWPLTLITWSRVLAGKWRDPIVGRDVLVAVLAAVLTNAIRHAVYLGFSPAGAPPEANVIDSGGLRFTLDHLLGTRHIASAASFAMFGGFIQSVQMLFLIFLCRAALRNIWLSAAAYIAIIAALTLPTNPQDTWIESLLLLAIAGVAVVMLVRLGLLALAVWGSVGSLIERGLLTHEFGAWYGESSLIVVCIVSALAVWAFRTSLGRRPVFAPAFDQH
jgi:hypothetical protein